MSDKPLDHADYAFHPVFEAIKDRFQMIHRIRIEDHIASVEEVYWRTELGWQTYVVAPLAKLSIPVASALARFHPIVPNSRSSRVA